MEGMTTPRSRLETIKENIRGVPSSPEKAARMAVSIDCAVEIAESLVGLTVAVQSLEQNSVIVMSNLIKKIDEATIQAAEFSRESGNVARESANLSGQLNSLTKWIVGAALLSALAAAIQAGMAVYVATHPQQI